MYLAQDKTLLARERFTVKLRKTANGGNISEMFTVFCPTTCVRWPTTVTSKQNAHIKFKSLTSNSNHSHQIQITHNKFKLLTANYKSVTANYKSFTSNTNRSHQIQIVHMKYKSLTAKKQGLRIVDLGMQTAD